MSLPELVDSAIVLRADAADWRSAVRLVGAALVASGSTTAGYSDEMIRMIEEHGPYVVIAPGLALAHARPGADVLADGLAVVTLESPVKFGHPHNDPVKVVLGLALRGTQGHLESIADLANIFNDSTAIADLAAAATADEVRTIMGS
ncbi:PTS sugar transporter subunit IIA [soil metagenome]